MDFPKGLEAYVGDHLYSRYADRTLALSDLPGQNAGAGIDQYESDADSAVITAGS